MSGARLSLVHACILAAGGGGTKAFGLLAVFSKDKLMPMLDCSSLELMTSCLASWFC